MITSPYGISSTSDISSSIFQFFLSKTVSNQRIQYNYNVFKMGRRLLLIINRENEKEKVKWIEKNFYAKYKSFFY